MKTQSSIVEYILIVLLATSVLGYTLVWFNQNKSIVANFITENQIQDRVKLIDNFIYNFEAFKYARQIVRIEGIKGFCEGNVTILQTSYPCTPSPKNITFQGYFITINSSKYIYSNRTASYYPAVSIGYYLYKSCYEGFVTYVVNTSECELACVGTCELTILKDNQTIKIR
jgi:hypothetical protein